jgi:dTDP-4-amino-4,6-dideoxygalactose transaminase
MPSPKIWLSSPHIGQKEREYVALAFDTNWVAPLGPNVNGFEEDLAKYTGVNHAAALSSGTAALHLALIILGVKSGDEVICQSFTFCGSANPIVYLGATPVFVDSEPQTWNICPDFLRQAIEARLALGKKPKAIVAVHLYGAPAKIMEIKAIAEQYQIPLIEDAAEALGSSLHGKACGSFGDLGVLSFNGNKIITTSGGGALIGNDAQQIEKARFLSTQARDSAPHYQHSEIGYNYRMSNICAGIGRGQMEVLNERVQQRRENFEFYCDVFKDRPGFDFQGEIEGSFSNRWLSSLTIEPSKTGFSREDLRLHLESDNIESRPLWKPMHLQPVYASAPYYGEKVCENLFEKGICLPSGSNLTDEDRGRIRSKIEELMIK